MERISHLLLPPRRTSSATAFGAMAVMALLLVSGLRLAAQSPDPTPAVPPSIPKWRILPSGGKVGNEHAALYIHSRNAKDSEGKDIPYTQLLDIKADQIPLNQVWKIFEAVVSDRRPNLESNAWDSRDERISGPRVNLDLNSATPAEVLGLLTGLAKEHGVAAYKAPDARDPGPFMVVKFTKKDGQFALNLHARQVSLVFLDRLLETAKKMSSDTSSGFDRDSDQFTGPKVDAIFEGLTLQELEARVRKLQAEAQ